MVTKKKAVAGDTTLKSDLKALQRSAALVASNVLTAWTTGGNPPMSPEALESYRKDAAVTLRVLGDEMQEIEKQLLAAAEPVTQECEPPQPVAVAVAVVEQAAVAQAVAATPGVETASEQADREVAALLEKYGM
jgi:hypothetical protein